MQRENNAFIAAKAKLEARIAAAMKSGDKSVQAALLKEMNKLNAKHEAKIQKMQENNLKAIQSIVKAENENKVRREQSLFIEESKKLEQKLAYARKRGDKSFERELLKQLNRLNTKHAERVKRMQENKIKQLIQIRIKFNSF
jgi:hypothetical protein